MRLLSAEAQRLAPPGSTYGYDVLVRLGWRQRHQHATYREIHHDLSARLAISEAHVRYLYQHVYLPLRVPRTSAARAFGPGGARARRLIIALDGLAPQGGGNLVHSRLIHGADAAQVAEQLDQPTPEGLPRPPEAPGVANFGRAQ